MPALDYERIAALYDTYCVYTGDLEYLLAAASSASSASTRMARAPRRSCSSSSSA